MSAIDSFKQIVGCDDEFARSFLESHSNNLEAAVQAFYGNDVVALPSSTDDGLGGPSAMFEDARERAPLPQFRDKLIDVDPAQRQQRRPPPTNAANHPLEAFRDFHTETAGAGTGDGEASADEPKEVFGLTKKPKNLAEIYRAPTELCFIGNFDELRDAGRRQSRWLLVNIQSPTEFASQQLNADTWCDETLREVVKARSALPDGCPRARAATWPWARDLIKAPFARGHAHAHEHAPAGPTSPSPDVLHPGLTPASLARAPPAFSSGNSTTTRLMVLSTAITTSVTNPSSRILP